MKICFIVAGTVTLLIYMRFLRTFSLFFLLTMNIFIHISLFIFLSSRNATISFKKIFSFCDNIDSN